MNFIGITAAGLMTAAMFFPWWSIKLQFSEKTLLYPYLLDGPISEFVGYKRSPQMMILTGVLILAIVLCLAGSFLSKRAGRICMAISVAVTFLAIWRLLARIGNVASRYHLPLQGHEQGSLGGFAKVWVTTLFEPGFYLIGIAALLALAAVVLHNRFWIKIEG
jgi:hypothetical protein